MISTIYTYENYKAVHNRYYNSLCYFANSIVLERAAAEDIVEDMFLKLWMKEPNFQVHKNIKAALYLRVKNACLDYLRKRKIQDNRMNELSYLLKEAQEDFILSQITRAELLREVYEALEQLPKECRNVMELYFHFGLDHKSIAAKLGITISTVKNHKSRGIQLLRKKLGDSLMILLFPM